MIVYRCNLIDGKLIETMEVKNPAFFTKNKLPDNLAGAFLDRAILARKNKDVTIESIPSK
jgi:hypothetical protein